MSKKRPIIPEITDVEPPRDPYTDKNVLVFIHGITPAPEPSQQSSLYTEFLTRMQRAFTASQQKVPDNIINLYWGFNPHPNTESSGDHLLAPVERRLFQMIQEEQDRTAGIELNPFALIYRQIRKLFILGFADMFYYVSTQGKAQVQVRIFDSFLSQLPELKDNERYSFTIISHSAGTVIMQDLLYTIFGRNATDPLPQSYAREHAKRPSAEPAPYSLEQLRDLAADARIRIKCFVTLGSPIAPMIVRHQDVVEHIHNSGKAEIGKLSLHDIGIRPSVVHADSKWLNFWDIDDVVSYPSEFLYDNKRKMLMDFRVRNAGLFTQDAHNHYWFSDDVARLISVHYPND
jgi:hypothetical protein